MAKEIVKTLRVDAEQGITSVKELKKAISECRDSLVAMDQSMGDAAKETDEYKSQVEQLQGYQKTLNDVMGVTKKKADAVAGSYDDLNAQLTAARREWKSLSEEQRNADAKLGEDGLLGRIQSLDKQLKNMDDSIGLHQRHVGDYAGQIASIAGLFGGAGKAASGAIGSVQGLTAGLKAMSGTPVIAILGVLVTILQKVISSIKTSEDNVNALSMAFAPLKTAGDLVTKMFQGLGKALASAATWFTKVLDKLGLVTDEMRERQDLAAKEIELQKSERALLYENADTRKKIAELNAKSTEKDKYSAQERVAFIEEAGRLEQEIAKKTYEQAKLAYEVKKRKNALTESSAEDLKEEAQLYATMVNAETDYFNKMKEHNARKIEAMQQQASERAAHLSVEKELIEQELALAKTGSEEELKLTIAKRAKQYEIDKAAKTAAIKDKKTLAKTLILLEKAYLADLKKINDDYQRDSVTNNVKYLTNRMNTYTQGSEEYLKRAVFLKQYEIDTLQQMDKESDEDYKARKLAAHHALITAQQSLYDYQVAQARRVMENEKAALKGGSIEALSKAVDIARYDLENTYQKIGESDADFTARILANEKALAAAQEALYDGQAEQGRLRLENRMNEAVAGSAEYLARAVELKKYELDTLHQMEEESDEAFRARQLAAQKAYTDSKQALLEKSAADFQSYASAVSSIAGSVADIIESSTNGDEKAARQAKNIRIASAIIDTLAGAVTAFAQAQSLGPIKGPIVGAVNAGAVIAAGYAQVQKIRATQVSASTAATTSASSVTTSAPTPTADIPTTAVATTASDTDRLNEIIKSQKVYILSDDLEANSRRVKVVASESSF